MFNDFSFKIRASDLEKKCSEKSSRSEECNQIIQKQKKAEAANIFNQQKRKKKKILFLKLKNQRKP